MLTNSQAWSGFSFLVGFLVVFRTSQAYSRFWDGCTSTHKMSAEWFDAASALVAFCEHSKADPSAVDNFKQTLVRLFSMMHACALANIEDNPDESTIAAYNYPLIDADAIDEDSLDHLQGSESKVELVFGWIQMLVVHNISTGVLSIPPPILSRAFQELANGMVQFHEAMKISTVPFPFPYAQTCDCLLLMHWLIVPFVTAVWVPAAWWAAIFCFIQVFIFWTLNFIAVEIENPFGMDDNDIDGKHMQQDMNRQLVLLVHPMATKVPTLRSSSPRILKRATTLRSAWSGSNLGGLSPTLSDRNNKRPSVIAKVLKVGSGSPRSPAKLVASKSFDSMSQESMQESIPESVESLGSRQDNGFTGSLCSGPRIDASFCKILSFIDENDVTGVRRTPGGSWEDSSASNPSYSSGNQAFSECNGNVHSPEDVRIHVSEGEDENRYLHLEGDRAFCELPRKGPVLSEHEGAQIPDMAVPPERSQGLAAVRRQQSGSLALCTMCSKVQHAELKKPYAEGKILDV